MTFSINCSLIGFHCEKHNYFDFRLCARASDIVTLHVTKFFVGSISMGRLYNFQGEALKL